MNIKKTLTLILALLLSIALLAACGKKTTDDAEPAATDAPAQTNVTGDTAAPTAAPTETPTSAPTETAPTEAAPTETEPAPTETEPPETDPTRSADDIYADVLQTYMDKWDASEDFIYREYAFHDIDEDGTEELIVHDGTCENDRTYYFYTVRDGEAAHLGNCEGWHGALADGNRYITLYAGMNGEGTSTPIRIEGGALLFEESEPFTFPPIPDFGPDIVFTTY